MGHTIKSNPEDIWENLNSRCHNNFGYKEFIKESRKSEDLQWAEKTLPAYILWDKFSEFHSLVNCWIKKINKELNNSQLDLNDERIILHKNKYNEDEVPNPNKRFKNRKGKEKEANIAIEDKDLLITCYTFDLSCYLYI